MNLNQPEDFVDVFLESCYPEEEGWACFRDAYIEGIDLDYVFAHADGSQVWIVRTGDPIVSKAKMNDLSVAASARELLLGSSYVHVAIICGSLLLGPDETPNNVEVISLVDQYEEFLPSDILTVHAN